MTYKKECDVVLIGAGIMSATLGSLLKELEPGFNIEIFERLDGSALESSDEWNNAGTGHAGFCELNYTPEKNGKVDISKAVKVNEDFEISRQYWSYLVRTNKIKNDFIKKVPHMSMVEGDENISFLKNRYEALKTSVLFEDIKYSEDLQQIKNWCPLIVENRKENKKIAVSYSDKGTDVNFGSLTRQIIENLQSNGVVANFNHEVVELTKKNDFWITKVKNLITGDIIKMKSKYHEMKKLAI